MNFAKYLNAIVSTSNQMVSQNQMVSIAHMGIVISHHCRMSYDDDNDGDDGED